MTEVQKKRDNRPRNRPARVSRSWIMGCCHCGLKSFTFSRSKQTATCRHCNRIHRYQDRDVLLESTSHPQ